MALPFQVSEPGSPRAGTAQKRQTSLPVRLIVGGHESAHALVAAGDARDDQVADDHRRTGGVVVLVPVGHLGFPEQRARGAVEGDEVRVVGGHEHAIAGDGHAAVDAARGDTRRGRACAAADSSRSDGRCRRRARTGRWRW